MFRYVKGDEHELIATYANHLASQHNNLEYLGLATGIFSTYFYIKLIL